MSRSEEEFEPIGDEPSQYVPAVYAQSRQEAEYYRELLSDHDIPAVLGEEDEEDKAGSRSRTRGVPVLVPDAFLEEASEIIADREDVDDFEEDEDLDDEDDDEDVDGESEEGEECLDEDDEDEDEKYAEEGDGEDEDEVELDEDDEFLDDEEDEDLDEDGESKDDEELDEETEDGGEEESRRKPRK